MYEKTLKTSMVDKKIDEKEAQELKKIYNQYIDTKREIMKSTSFQVEDVYDGIMGKVKFIREQITKLNKFLAKIMEV